MTRETFMGYLVYGPYLHTGEGRRYVNLIDPNDRSKRTTLSYARYLVCRDQNRWLEKWEQVDHIDNDRLNDTIENLQILSGEDNLRKHTDNLPPEARKKVLELVCPNCHVTFTRDKNQVHKGVERKILPCCSRSCSGQYQHKV